MRTIDPPHLRVIEEFNPFLLVKWVTRVKNVTLGRLYGNSHYPGDMISPLFCQEDIKDAQDISLRTACPAREYSINSSLFLSTIGISLQAGGATPGHHSPPLYNAEEWNLLSYTFTSHKSQGDLLPNWASYGRTHLYSSNQAVQADTTQSLSPLRLHSPPSGWVKIFISNIRVTSCHWGGTFHQEFTHWESRFPYFLCLLCNTAIYPFFWPTSDP